MTGGQNETVSVVVEREFAHPPERVWRALTQPELLADWLMRNDFRAEQDHRFQFRAEWGEVDCQVLEVRPMHSLSYTWSAFDVDTVVTFTLEPMAEGTRLRMEQTGFRPNQKQALGGAKGGWAAFLVNLERTLGKF
ncbi:SRPBCC family protein [Paracoccus methylarcula]|uniref:SRPBCC domain-containing protein n=1 Tax=Paracoccus methylarcula TaxID=72022 RepID=A0A3R7M7Y4_9RHOB|nr:SRPBCC domain-containing protein [Paracoccus methylarcula]RNF33510.1 SRPBCC domain-containing protein [Paracoccus methylarcula]